MDFLSGNRRLGFGDFILDLERRVLMRQGAIVKLPAKVLDTLVVLVEERGAVVSKEALLARVWPKTVVEESGLQRNISLLRKVLQENGAGDLIETVPKRGYRFNAGLREVGEIAVPIAPGVANAGSLPSPPVTTRRFGRRAYAWAAALAVLVVACASFFGLRSTHERTLPGQVTAPSSASVPEATAPVLNQITRNASALTVITAAISPDGRHLVFDEGGSLRLREVSSGKITELPVPQGTQIQYLTWMPSNDEVLLTVVNLHSRICEIWRVFLSGAPPRKLVDDAFMAGVSPRGDRIAFTRGSFELWTMAPDGSEAELFLEAPPTSRVFYRPAFSRDGKRIYVIGFGRDDGWNLTVYDLATKRPVFKAPLGPIADFTLLDDATMLAVLSTTGGVWRGVYLATLTLDFRTQTVTETQRLPDWPDYRVTELSATADGRTVSFVRSQAQADIYVAKLARDGNSISDARRLTLDDGADRVTAWAADGRSVLFHASRDSGLGMYRQDLDAPRAVRLHDDGQMNWQPVTSSDGRWLIYMTFPPGGFPSPDHPQTLMRQRLDGSVPPEPLAKSTHGISAVNCARQTPRCLFLNYEEGKSVFYDLNAGTGRLKRLFTLPVQFEFNFNWSVSPDGRSLAYIERNSAGMRIAVRDLDALGAMRVSMPVEGSGILRSLAWDTEGKGLFVMQCMGEGGLLLHIDLKGAAAILQAVHSGCDGWALPSPDGMRLAFVELTSTGNLWTLQRH
jgi:DNA-binding winged helix-turn-helix (wHTH) protein